MGTSRSWRRRSRTGWRRAETPADTAAPWRSGITLITNIAGVLGIAAGLTDRRTIKRLRGAATAGQIDTELQEGLEEAFGVLWRTRLEHHVRCWQSGRPLDDFVDPRTLGPLSRRALKEAFGIIARAQDMLATEF